MRQLLSLLFYSCIIFFSKNIKAQPPTIGLIQSLETAQFGYTLISPPGKNTYLIDNCGKEVQRWVSDFDRGHRAYLTEDGLLLRGGIDPDAFIFTSGKSGIVELFTMTGELTWQYKFSSESFISHHDMAPLPNGNILLLVIEEISIEEAEALGRNPDLLPSEFMYIETVVELKPLVDNEAEVVWRWRLSDHLVQDYDSSLSNYGIIQDNPHLINFNFSDVGASPDWLHLNGIDYNPTLDQIALSSRHTGEIYIIDHSTTEAEAATGSGGNSGKGGDFLYRWGNPIVYDRGTIENKRLFGPHDVNWIKEGYENEGQIVVFNNGGGRPEGNFSTVDVISPLLDAQNNYLIEDNQPFAPTNPDVGFVYTPPENFYASNTSGAEQLKNGNFLVCHGPRGWLVEVNNANEVVWEYINPITNMGAQDQGSSFPLSGNSLFSVTRYNSDFPGFNNYEINTGEVLEANPYPNECTTTSINEVFALLQLQLSPNPVSSNLQVKGLKGTDLHLKIFNLNGQTVHTQSVNTDSEIINTSTFRKGFYYLEIWNKSKGIRLAIEKFVKL